LGSLDYWGILSFFVPLWVLALCFNLYSKEEELGTLRQLRAEGLGTAQILMPKAISVAIMIGGFIFSMSLLSWLLARPSPDGNRMIRIFVAQCAYLLFWVGMGVAVAALRLSSARSALMALTVWVSLNWVVPEIFNLRDRPDLHESSVRILSRHRTTLNRYWDLPKKAPLEAFNHPPEWMKTALENTDEAFSWGWYYSMHEATDEQFRSAFESNRIKSEKHSEALAYTSLAGWFESYLDAQIGLDTRERSNSFEVAQRARLELLTRWFPWMVPDQELEVQQVRNLMRSAIHQ
jgi:ABC-2 type transport system permease protein